MNEKDCCCAGSTVTVLACSGGSNVGQLTNEVAKRIDAAGDGKFFCLAGVGGHVSGMVASVAGSDRVLVIDGCPVACARKTMEAAGFSEFGYVVVTDLGVEKVHNFDLSDNDIRTVMSACRAALDGSNHTEGTNETELVETADSGGAYSSSECCSGGQGQSAGDVIA